MPTQTKIDRKAHYFDLRDFDPLDQEEQYLICVNSNTYHVLFALFKFYGKWPNRYVRSKDDRIWYQPEGEEIAFVGDMFDRGMEELQDVTCMGELVKTQRMLVAAIVGENVDLNSPLPDSVDYSEVGLVPTLKQMDVGGGDTDELEQILDAIQIILGGAAILAG